MKFSCYSKSVPKAWLHDKYSTEKEARLRLFGSRKGGREGKMSFSVLRVCSSLNITCKYVHLWLEVQRIHLELLPGAQGNKKAGKAGKGGMISMFFKLVHLGRAQGRTSRCAQGLGASKKPHPLLPTVKKSLRPRPRDVPTEPGSLSTPLLIPWSPSGSPAIQGLILSRVSFHNN